MSEKREWRNVPPETIIRDIIESSGLSAKQAIENAIENYKFLPSAKDFMNGARSEPVSEEKAPYGEPSEQQRTWTPEQRLEALKDLRTDLHTVAERLHKPLQALDALKAAQARLQTLMDDARAKIE